MNRSLAFKRSNSAQVACERLQILFAHERSARGRSDLISILMEILAAISRHVAAEPDKVQVKIDRGDALSTLEIKLEIPNMAKFAGFPEGPTLSRRDKDLQAGGDRVAPIQELLDAEPPAARLRSGATELS